MARDEQFTSLQAYLGSSACSGEVLAVHGREELGRPYRYVVDVLLEEIDLDAISGSSLYVNVQDGGDERHLHGLVERFEIEGTPHAGLMNARLHVVPLQYALVYRRGFRIFQDLTVQDVVTQVFTDAGLEESLFRWDIQGSYEVRDYTVQYDETEWDFVCRLLEDEGIWFAFEHDADAAVMVFGDDSGQVEALEPGTLTFFDETSERTWGHTGFVFAWTRTRLLCEGKVSLDDYDGLHPSLPLGSESESDEPFAREHYEYPGGYLVAAEGSRRAEVRLQELSSRRRAARATSDLITLQPGRRFELLDHPSAIGEFVITAADIALVVDPQATRTSFGAIERPPHCVSFECVPRDQHFRSRRTTPRPKIHGFQTARVTGPAGEEIHCDEHGRVKVQFAWDLDGQLDENTTCWIRSTHPHTTGSVMVPRIGWEVLVQFYDGDPDRPVVLGHLFNPLHAPAYPLPAEKTVTGHRTVSSPGAGAVNEVAFDDASGAQQIKINAGKDLTLNTVNNKNVQTANVVTKSVVASRSFSVGADETISLQANHDGSVGGDHTITIGGNRTTKVSGGASNEVVGSTTIDVGGLENMMIGNPIDAVLQIIKSEAIAAAEGAAASAADRVQGALLGPVMPALDAVNGALGEAASYAGPAAAILGADNPAVALYGDTLASISAATTPPDLAGMAGGMAQAVASGALDAASGGGDGGGDGTWGTVVGGDVSETIGALAAINSAYGVAINVGGNNTETIGAARAEIVKGGHSEDCASKTETVGVYFVNAAGGFGVEATGAIALNVAASKMTLGKGYAATAAAVCAVTAATISLDASETVTLKCGSAEVIIDKSGIGCKGAISVTIKGTGSVKVKPPAIGP